MRVFNKTLPEYCYNAGRQIEPEIAVVHFISVDIGNPALVSELEEWQRFDINTIHHFLMELNSPGHERGRVFRANPDLGRAYGSYHRLISQGGERFRLVPDDRYAYHAGYSRFQGRDNCNWWSLGIALAGPPYTAAQYEALINELQEWGFGKEQVTGHENVRREWKKAYPEIAQQKGVPDKHDPGQAFSWPAVLKHLR